jgi:LCP family protein required for cell wall assembly
MSHNSKARALTLLKFTLLLAGVGTALLQSFWRRPLGPALELPARPTFVLPAPADVPLPLILPTPAPVEAAQAPAPKPLCGGPGVMNILAIGTDYRYENYLYGLSDVIKMVRVDFVTPRVMLVDFPRDLYVEIPGIAEHGGITHGKLNQAYLYGNPGLDYYQGPGEGPGLLARTLDLNFGAHPDHYLAVNMLVFPKILDAVGGVDVDLPDWSLGYRPGVHHMNGQQALDFSRVRPDGTFERTHRQDYVVAALWDRLREPSVLSHTGDLVKAFQGSVQTDLSPEQINQLTCLASKLDREDVVFLGWPESMFKGARMDDPVLGNTFVWDVDFDLMRLFVAAFHAGQWPLPEAMSAAPQLP